MHEWPTERQLGLHAAAKLSKEYKIEKAFKSRLLEHVECNYCSLRIHIASPAKLLAYLV